MAVRSAPWSSARRALPCWPRGTAPLPGPHGKASRLATLPTAGRKTLTYDPGKQMAHHQGLASRLKIRGYFADPHSPWQRPTNENTNGLIRQYLPKGRDLSGISQRWLTPIATALNTRLRRCLHFRTPQEVMAEQIKKLQSWVALQT